MVLQFLIPNLSYYLESFLYILIPFSYTLSINLYHAAATHMLKSLPFQHTKNLFLCKVAFSLTGLNNHQPPHVYFVFCPTWNYRGFGNKCCTLYYTLVFIVCIHSFLFCVRHHQTLILIHFLITLV